MFTKEDATKERVADYSAALEREKAGYEARIARVDGGRPDPLPKEQLELRVKEVDAELARVSKLAPKK